MVDLLKRCLVLPGLHFAEIFFKDEIARMLKEKINLPDLKKKIDELKEKEELTKYLLNQKDVLELVWTMVGGSVFLNQNNSDFPWIIEEDCLDQPEFLDNIFGILINYEQKFIGGKAHALSKARKNLEAIKPEVKEEKVNQETVNVKLPREEAYPEKKIETKHESELHL